MKFLKALTQKKLAKAVVCGLVVSGGMVVGMGQADAATYILGAYPYGVVHIGHSDYSVVIDRVSVSETQNQYANEYNNGAEIWGYYTGYSGELKNGTVDISGGNISGTVNGGVDNDGGNAVTISGGTVSGMVNGGNSSGNANNNTITISGGTVSGAINGGNASKNADGNIITITDGTISGVINGGNASGDASNNIITISGGTFDNSGKAIYGGKCNGKAENNTVTINNVNLKSMVVGAYGASANGNTISINGEVQSAVYCGYASRENADENTITISGDKTKIGGMVLGGYCYASACKNKVDILGGELSSVYGGYGYTKNADENTITISGDKTKIGGTVYGGSSNKDDANNNTIKMSGGEVQSTIFCGYAAGNANNNTFEMTDGAINVGKDNMALVVGYSINGNADGNTATIKGGTITSSVRAGYSNSGSANNNIVNISGGTLEDLVQAGNAVNGNANGNTVTITGGTIQGAVTGGRANANAEGNTITISGGEVQSTVYGGYSSSANAEGNTITISGGEVQNTVYGGYSSSANADENTITISGNETKIGKVVYGGYADENGEGNADKNTVTISGGELSQAVNAGFSYNGTANENTLIITGDKTKINSNVYGGNGGTSASKNKVNILGGELKLVYGGYAYTGSANNNIVNISSGNIESYAVAGYSNYDGDANNNILNVSGGSIDNYVVAGWARAGGASNNTVNLIGTGGELKAVTGYDKEGKPVEETVAHSGDKDITITSYIYGGYGKGSSTGNTLNVAGTGTTAAGITNFQNLNFYLPAAAEDGAVMVRAINVVDLQDIDALNTVIADKENATVGYTLGKTITLLSSENEENDFTALSKEKLQINGQNAAETTIEATTLPALKAEVEAKVGYAVSAQKIDFKTKSIKLLSSVNIAEDVTLDSELDMNGKRLNMQQNDTEAAKYNTLSVNKLVGDANLAIDVDLATGENDKIKITGNEESKAYINLDSIFVRKDLEGEDRTVNNKVTAIEGENLKGITFDAENPFIKTSTTDFIYTFSQGEAGKLNVTKETADNIVDFIQGTRKYVDVNTYTLTEDVAAKADLGTTKREGDKVLTIAFNEGTTLSGNKNEFAGAVVAEGYTLKLLGLDGAAGRVSNFKAAAVENNGTLEVENIKFEENQKDIINNGTLNLAGANEVSNITGAGTMNVNAGTTTVYDALEQKAVNVAKEGKLLQKEGSVVVKGDMTNEGNVTLSNLGGSDVDYKTLETAKNKVEGKLTNNGTFNLEKTYLTVSDFAGKEVNVDKDSLLYIINLKSEVDVTANSVINEVFKADTVEEKITVKQNPDDNTPLAVATSFDKALQKIETEGVGKFAAKFTGAGKLVVPEGILDGETTFDKNGVHKAKGANNDVVDSLATAATFARVEINDIRKRMGDVRQVKDTKGIWARSENGKLEGLGMDAKFHKFQIGSDNAVSDKWRVGGAVSYTNGNAHYNHGSNSNKTYSGAAYGMYTGKNGEFVDVIARVGLDKTKLNFTAGGVQQHGDLDRMAYALSSEVGKTYELKNSFYVEPQAELTYTYSGSDDFTSNGAKYDLDNANSFIGRLGFTLGYKNDQGGVYTRLSLLHEFAGDKELTASSGGITKTYSNDGKDSWVEWAIGGQIQTSKATYIYADAEKTFGANVNEKYRVNVGLRYSF